MRSIKLVAVTAAMPAAGLVYTPFSSAATATSTLAVAAAVLQTCIAAATTVVFGTFTVYGRLPGAQALGIGAYADLVQLTVNH
ncbi:MAG: hypothetical protein V4772_18815 [Pseudomonadota bacterium]